MVVGTEYFGLVDSNLEAEIIQRGCLERLMCGKWCFLLIFGLPSQMQLSWFDAD